MSRCLGGWSLLEKGEEGEPTPSPSQEGRNNVGACPCGRPLQAIGECLARVGKLWY